jgi:hypothetical protein
MRRDVWRSYRWPRGGGPVEAATLRRLHANLTEIAAPSWGSERAMVQRYSMVLKR